MFLLKVCAILGVAPHICYGAFLPMQTLGPQCDLREPQGPAQITSNCIDPLFDRPVVDEETEVTLPQQHRQVVGHFEGTDVRFTIYLPPTDNWQGRFFQHLYPTQNHTATELELGAALTAGAYFVQNTGTSGYRADAATAKFSRQIARLHYRHEGRIPGYLYGGSGGSLQGVGAVENTFDVWDGACLIVLATPPSNPINPAAKALAAFVLRDRAQDIGDAVRPGGSRDPEEKLNALQRSVLRESSKMGVPLRAWEDFASISDLDLLFAMRAFVEPLDPTYSQDHWSKVGYLGTDVSELGLLIQGARLVTNTTVASVTRNADGNIIQLELDGEYSSHAFEGFELLIDGTILQGFFTENGLFSFSEQALEQAKGIDFEDVAVGLDNSWYLSMLSYHRHAIPSGRFYPSFEQFLDADQKPIFPQRGIDVARTFSESLSGGAKHTGNVNCKVILLDNLLDSVAFPWQADWYYGELRRALGSRADDSLRIYFNDHVDHNSGPIALPRKKKYLVQADGLYHQALRDLSDWVESGKTPPSSTVYDLENGQVRPKEKGKALQPDVKLTVGGSVRVEVSVGKAITLEAHVVVSPGSGEVILIEWDHLGSGEYSIGAEPSRSQLTYNYEVKYSKPGTYFPNVRVTTHRDGDAKSPYHRILTLGRARVMVE